VYTDPDNYFLLARVFCDTPFPTCSGMPCTLTESWEVTSWENMVTGSASLTGRNLRLIRVGSRFWGYYSGYGERWTLVGCHYTEGFSPVWIGLATGFDEDNQCLAADFDYFQVLSDQGGPPPGGYEMYLPLAIRAYPPLS